MEIQILDWLQKLHTPVLDKIMCLITRLGDAGILWILLAAVLLLIPKTRKSGLILAGALVVDALLCNVILKPLVARIRPYDVNTAVQLLVSSQWIILSRPDTPPLLLRRSLRFLWPGRGSSGNRHWYWLC